MMDFIPTPYKVLAGAAVLCAAGWAGWIEGAQHVQGKWDEEAAAQARQAIIVENQQSKATVQVVTQYVDRIKVVREKGATIVKEVPVYVTAQSDAGCSIPVGFVRVHDAAATGTLPSAPGVADETSSGVALSAVAGTVASNYSVCRENAEQLMALQGWVKAQAEIGRK